MGYEMCVLIIVVFLVILLLSVVVVLIWQMILFELGKCIELDCISIKCEGNMVQVQGWIVFDKELIDIWIGVGYWVIEVIMCYDCGLCNVMMIKWIYKKNEMEIFCEEELKGSQLLVCSGIFDDKVLCEVCCLFKESVVELV